MKKKNFILNLGNSKNKDKVCLYLLATLNEMKENFTNNMMTSNEIVISTY